MNVIGYVRVSTEEQALSGLGLEAQKESISAAVAARGWTLCRWAVDDGYTAKPGAVKPALLCARASTRAGEADAIMASKLDRFARSTQDMAELLRESQDPRHGYRLVFLDLGGVDTGTAAGKLIVQMMSAVAEWERDVISERTKAALAARRARGLQVGSAPLISPEVEARVLALHGENLSYRQIAATLTQSKVPTVRGGDWQVSTIQGVLARANNRISPSLSSRP